MRSIIERFEDGNQAAFARSLGLSKQAVSKMLGGAIPSGGTLETLMRRYPLVRAEWLLTGRGEMAGGEREGVGPVVAEGTGDFLEVMLREARAAEKRAEAAAAWARWLEKEADASARVRALAGGWGSPTVPVDTGVLERAKLGDEAAQREREAAERDRRNADEAG